MYRRPDSRWRNVALWCLGAAVLAFLLSGKAGPGSGRFARSSTPPRAAKPLPKPAADAQALQELADRNAPPDEQRAGLERYLAGRGVSRRAIATVLRHTQDGIVLTPGPGSAETRVGGEAVLPRGEPWPNLGDDFPFTFIAAIDFGELPHLKPLPRQGTLALYWNMAWPDVPRDRAGTMDYVAGTRAYYLPPGTAVDHPRGPEQAERVDRSPLRGHVVPVAGEPSRVTKELGTGRELDRLLKAMNEATRTDLYGDHHVLGTSIDIQHTPADELGAMFDPKRDWLSAASRDRFTPAERDPQRWRLLAEINETADLTIADGGVLYFMILDSDLRDRRFDRVVGVMDSH